MIAGQYITDGSAVFIIRDIRDGTPVGRPITDDILRDSYVKRNGALLQRSSYPTLVKFLQDNPSLVTTEANWPNAKNMWTWGDGRDTTGTTIRVPDDRGLYEQLSDVVGLVDAGLPNIEATLNNGPFGNQPPGVTGGATWSGAFWYEKMVGIAHGAGDGPGAGYYTEHFDASRSNSIYGNSDTVTPPSVLRIAQMKY